MSCIAAGRQHAIAVTAEGEVYHWGARQFIEPRLLTTLQGIRIVHVSPRRGLRVRSCGAVMRVTRRLNGCPFV